MASDRIKKNYTTQKGELTGFISVFKPSVKFNKKGAYSASILLSAEEGKKLTALAKEVTKEQFKTYGKGKKISELTCVKPYTTVNDEGEEIPDKEGRYILKTSGKAWLEDGVPQNKILVVDSKKQPIKNISIGQGSEARLFVTLEGYTTPKETNVSAVLKAVQIIKLVEYSNVDIQDAGFEEEEGYIFDPETEDETKEAETDNEENDDEEEDF